MKARRKRPRRPEPVGPEPELWLITFCDLLMVLVSMFALVFSMNVISEQSLRSSLAKLRTAAGGAVPQAHDGGSSTGWSHDENIDPTTEETLHRLTDGLSHLLGAPTEERSDGNPRIYAGGLAVALTSNALTARLGPGSFSQNGAELTFQSEESIRVIARAIKDTPFPIEIETYEPAAANGNGTDLPWQLAQERSLSVLRQFLDTGVGPSTLSAAGYVAKDTSSGTFKPTNETLIRIVLPHAKRAPTNAGSSWAKKQPISPEAGTGSPLRTNIP